MYVRIRICYIYIYIYEICIYSYIYTAIFISRALFHDKAVSTDISTRLSTLFILDYARTHGLSTYTHAHAYIREKKNMDRCAPAAERAGTDPRSSPKTNLSRKNTVSPPSPSSPRHRPPPPFTPRLFLTLTSLLAATVGATGALFLPLLFRSPFLIFLSSVLSMVLRRNETFPTTTITRQS